MSQQKVEQALLTAYRAGNWFSDSETQFENRTFTPPNAARWAAVWFLPTQPVVATLGDGGDDRLDGIFQIDLYYPQNKGSGTAGAMADTIRNAFTAGHRLVYQGQEVVIVNCGRSQGRIENNCFKIVVSVSFYAYLTR